MKWLNVKKWIQYLAGYYGVLQSLHLFFLSRAGLILQKTDSVPFPASPPPGGWDDAVMPFMMGMAAADVIAACIGIYFSFFLLVKGRLKPLAGIISLTIAISSAIVYLVGTLSAGAWVQNPLSYLIVILAFSPIVPLYFLLLRETAAKLEHIL